MTGKGTARRALDVKFLHSRLHGPPIAAKESKPDDKLSPEVIAQLTLQNKTFKVWWYLYGTLCWNIVCENSLSPLRIAGYVFLGRGIARLKDELFFVKNQKRWVFHICCFFSVTTGGCQWLPARAFQQGRQTSLSLQSSGDFSMFLFNMGFSFPYKVKGNVVKSRQEMYQHQNTENYFLIMGCYKPYPFVHLKNLKAGIF